MASKVIFDSPQLLDETLVSLTEAGECFPVHTARSTVERWIRLGSRGVILESIYFGGKRYTSKEAIERFVRSQLHVEADRPVTKHGSMSKRELEEKTRKYGLPTSVAGTTGTR